MITPRTQTSNPRFNILAPNPVRAALMMVAASSLIAITTLLAKVLGLGSEDAPLHPLQITAGRFLFALMALVFFFLLKRFKISAPD